MLSLVLDSKEPKCVIFKFATKLFTMRLAFWMLREKQTAREKNEKMKMCTSVSNPHARRRHFAGALPLERCQVAAEAVINKVSTHRRFVADRALDHVLVQLAIQTNEGLAHPAVHCRDATGIWAGDGRVRGRQFRCKDSRSPISVTGMCITCKVRNYQKISCSSSYGFIAHQLIQFLSRSAHGAILRNAIIPNSDEIQIVFAKAPNSQNCHSFLGVE